MGTTEPRSTRRSARPDRSNTTVRAPRHQVTGTYRDERAGALTGPGESARASTMEHSPDGPTGVSTENAQWLRAFREATARDEPLRLELYTRSAVPAFGTRSYREEVRERVAHLVEDGPVAEYSLEVWSEEVTTDPSRRPEERDEATIAEFRAWAERRGLELPFEKRRRTSSLIDEEYTVLIPPHVLAALYREDDLVAVAPYRDGERATSVMDLLTHLQERTSPGNDRASATP